MPPAAVIIDPRHGRPLPVGVDLARILRRLFRRQGQEVRQQIRQGRLPTLGHWLPVMAQLLAPPLAVHHRDGYQAAERRIAHAVTGRQRRFSFWGIRCKTAGQVETGFNVFNPLVPVAVQQLTLQLCQATLDTATMDVQRALAETRRQLSEGLSEGESVKQLNARLGTIFDDPFRAARIAQSESSRAMHLGQVAAAKDSGVVTKLRWVASSDACPQICQKLDGKEVELGEDFAIIGKGPYARVPHPPAHPHCMCALVEVIGRRAAPVQPAIIRPQPAPAALVPESVRLPVPPAPPPSRLRSQPIRTPDEIKQALEAYTVANEAITKLAQVQTGIDEAKKAKEQAGVAWSAVQQKQDALLIKLGATRSPNARKKVRAELEQIVDALNKADKENVSAREVLEQTRDKARAQALDIIRAKKPASVHLNTAWLMPSQGTIRVAAEKANQFLRQLIHDEGIPNGKVEARILACPPAEPQRSYCDQDGTVVMGNARDYTVVHEMGHHLEFKLPGVKEAALAFLKQRVGNEVPQSLNKLFPGGHYGDDEKGRKDDFEKTFGNAVVAYYAGKDYGDSATEIVSQGLELLYNDPAGFAVRDPEYFKFILGILDGTFRTNTP